MIKAIRDLIIGVGRMVECFEFEITNIMELIPEGLVYTIYKHKHEMLYSKVMKQLKTHRVNTVFLASLKFLEYGYFEFGGVRLPCIDIDNIDATSYEILCLINNDYRSKWVSGFGRAV